MEEIILEVALEEEYQKLQVEESDIRSGDFGTDLVILNCGQMTRTTPDLAPPSPNFRTTPAGGRLAPYVRFDVQQAQYTTDP
ncbi:hypothetical protein AVEN_237407-1 [Araneus ventricosus]|uniref:Uncharacterized protein n=1 Tax=Araneus ventricosus TaxID=182803 RepID=A0A4Y2UTR0_ARAVE|nr:hypothetical protein AVEN_237407-1 [Araneus ventricosus]